MDKAARLLLFADVVDAGSFTAAADHRNVNRSVISKQIGQLEEELSVRLFNRSTRSVSLTGIGQSIYPHALRMREALEAVEEVAQVSQKEPRGTLKLSVPSNFGHHVLPQVLREYLQLYPKVRVDLRLEDNIVDLIGGGYDLAIRISQPRDSTLIARPLARNRTLLVAAPTFIERHGTPSTLTELLAMPAVIYSREGLTQDHIEYFNDHGVVEKATLTSRYRANDPELLLGAVLDGLCFALMPAFSVGEDIAAGRLVPLLPQLKLTARPAIHMVYPHRQFLAQKTRGFITCLQKVVGSDTPVWERKITGFENMYGFVEGQAPSVFDLPISPGDHSPL
ncbi:LysR family transcriptional regulator [Carnimonas bestiolae]|uniref:LysR family transcriptional regulator n=1 Tax=Carnimonas bestiolae TaxID=3402172 RepID=UPI003EDC8015